MKGAQAALIALAIGLAFPDISPVWWPLVLAGLLLLRPWLGWLALLGLLLWRMPPLRSLLAGWAEQWQSKQTAALSIYPDKFWSDRPQSWWLYASHSQTLEASWVDDPAPIQVDSLGHGVFRLGFNPPRPGPSPSPSATVGLRVHSDGDGDRLFRLERIQVPVRPGMLVGLPALGIGATVSEATDEAIVFDRASQLRRLPTGDGPSAIQFLPGGRQLLVATRYGRDLEVLDLASGQVVQRVPLGAAAVNLAISPDGRRVAVLCEADEASLRLFKVAGLSLESSLVLPQPGEFVCFAGRHVVVSSRQGRCLYRATCEQEGKWVLSPRQRPLARPATGLCANASGQQVYLSSTSAQIRGGFQAGNHYVVHTLLTLDMESWFFSRTQVTEMRRPLQELPGGVDSGCGPQGLALDTKGNLLVAFSGSHEVGMIPQSGGPEFRYDLSPYKLFCPHSVVDLGQGVEVVSYPAQGTLAWLDFAGRMTQHRSLQGETLTLASEGEIDFYEATQSGVACQSCHPQGDTDYSRHDIGGARPWGTLTCQGIAGTPPYLRNGSYPRLQDLHDVTEGIYRGYRRQAKLDRAESMAEYIRQLPAPVNPRTHSLEQERRGLEVFFASGCIECHAFPALTNRASVRNKNLFAGARLDYQEWLDVPSLRGLWRSAPYLHDERAAGLRDVLTKENAADRHGRTRALTEPQLQDLMFFLQCL